MLRGLYSVAGAMQAASHNQDIVAENLVNATTPGYRRQGLAFELNSAANDEPTANAAAAPPAHRLNNSFVYFDTGTIQHTNNPYDFALGGDGFFAVDGPNGPLYTRNGCFQLAPNGQLQTSGAGYRVQGQGGPLAVPAGITHVDVSPDGILSANGAQIGRLRLVRINNPASARRVGPTLFESDDVSPAPAGSVRVEQGCREGSNVQPVQEMVSMMIGMRFYEAAQKAMQTMMDAVAQNTRPMQT